MGKWAVPAIALVLVTSVFVSLTPQAVAEPTPYSFLFKFGRIGFGDGEFRFPNGVAVDSSDRIIVADRQNHRIQVFDSHGIFQFKFGSFGTGNGQFNNPFRVAVDSTDRIIVTDLSNARIQVFNSNGIFLFKFGLSAPRGVATDSSDRIIVADANSDDIKVFDLNGNFLFNFGNIGPDKLINPEFVAVDSTDRIIVADSTNNRIQVFDSNGIFQFKFGSFGTGNGQFDRPLGIAVDSSDQIIVADQGNNRIQVFDSNGIFQFKFGSRGVDSGTFRAPTGVAVDSTDRIIVVDLLNNRIQVFATFSLLGSTNQGEIVEIDLNLNTVTLIGDAGVFEGRDLGWTDLSLDSNGNLFTVSRVFTEPMTTCSGLSSDGRCSHLYRVDVSTGAVIAEIGDTAFPFISDIDFAGDGTIFGNHFRDTKVTSDGGLLIINPNNAFTISIASFGSNPHSPDDLNNGGVFVHPITGSVWAVESNFSPAQSIFKVDPATGLAISPVVRLGLNGNPTNFGFDSLEILEDGRFIGTRGGPINEVYEINPIVDPISGLAEITLIPLTFDPQINGNVNGLTTVAIPKFIFLTIDIKPRSDPNAFNPDNKGKVSVAILSELGFDATTQINKNSLTFGRTGNEQSLLFCNTHLNKKADVNKDGLLDQICRFDNRLTGFQEGDIVGILKGNTNGGIAFQGSDSVKIKK